MNDFTDELGRIHADTSMALTTIEQRLRTEPPLTILQSATVLVELSAITSRLVAIANEVECLP